MDNRTIAQRLLEHARSLDDREPNMYRPRAFRRAAETLLRLDRPVENIVAEEGRKGLEALPGIGSHISYTIDGLVRTGEFRTLNRAKPGTQRVATVKERMEGPLAIRRGSSS